MNNINIKDHIRTIADFPKKGILSPASTSAVSPVFEQLKRYGIIIIAIGYDGYFHKNL